MPKHHRKCFFLAGIVIIVWFAFACSPTAQPAINQYEDQRIAFDFPNGKDVAIPDEEVFLAKATDACVFTAAKYAQTKETMQSLIKEEFDSIFYDDYVSYSINGSPATTRLLYCDYQTYALSMICPQNVDTSILESAECLPKEHATVPRLGIIPLPAGEEPAQIIPAIKESREIGADVLSWYFFWDDLADGWEVGDAIMPALSAEGKTAILMNIIYTNQLGKFPGIFTHFTDAGFKEQFAAFSKEFIARYHPDYYLIGGEVDIYFNSHRDEIEAYADFFSFVKHEIKADSPQTKIGMVFAYHDAIKNNALDIIHSLAAPCDIVAYTVHAYQNDFDYHDPARELQFLEEAAALIPGKPYGVIEAGWSDASLLGSSEVKQSRVVEDVIQFTRDSNAEFVIWFGLHEWEDCGKYADTFIQDMPVDETYRVRFETFMCSLGLKRFDDTPKQAYHTWLQAINR